MGVIFLDGERYSIIYDEKGHILVKKGGSLGKPVFSVALGENPEWNAVYWAFVELIDYLKKEGDKADVDYYIEEFIRSFLNSDIIDILDEVIPIEDE